MHDLTEEPAPTLPDDATEAIKLLYPREGGTVYRTIYAIVLDADEARDLTRETFVRAFRAWDRFDRTDARAWLLRIATNLAVTHDRTERRQRRAAPWASEDRDLVDWLMRPLTPEQRALITLHHYQQVPRAEIAAQLGIPIGTAASRIDKAMQVLRRRARAIGAMQVPEAAPEGLTE